MMKKKLIRVPLLLLGGATLGALGLGYLLSTPHYKGPRSDHFDGRRFFNPHGKGAHGFKETVKWMATREKGKWQEITNATAGSKPVSQIDGGIRITFVNHATLLIQTAGLNILTDPIWSERTSPFSHVGPKRMRPPGIRFEDLPQIHAIVISHNHYDHMDLPTLKRLSGRYGPVIFTPLGNKAFLNKHGIKGLIDLDWWTEYQLRNGVKIAAVPAQHFSGRSFFDRNTALWGGWIISSASGNVFFAGDTGYNEIDFKEIGKRHAPINAALLPIGAYKPEWFMGPIHVTPEQAIQAHYDLNAEVSIAMHYGTFPLADDGQYEPVTELKNAMKKLRFPEEKFLIIPEGTFYEVARP